MIVIKYTKIKSKLNLEKQMSWEVIILFTLLYLIPSTKHIGSRNELTWVIRYDYETWVTENRETWDTKDWIDKIMKGIETLKIMRKKGLGLGVREDKWTSFKSFDNTPWCPFYKKYVSLILTMKIKGEQNST